MIEFHKEPNGPWYARINGDGTVEYNPAFQNAEAALADSHPELAVVAKKMKDVDLLIDDLRTELKAKGVLVGKDKDLFDRLNTLKPEKP